MPDRASPSRLAIAGGVAVAILFALCWLGTVILPQGPSHSFVTIFTAAPVGSIAALIVGGSTALVFGALGGGLMAWSYNLTARS
jgi:hypothetical protein